MGKSAMFNGERVRNQGLGGRRVSRFTNPHQAAADKKNGKGGRQAAAHGRDTPEKDTGCNDRVLIKAIREVAGGNTGERQHNQQHGLQGTELRVRHAKVLTQQGKQRI